MTRWQRVGCLSAVVFAVVLLVALVIVWRAEDAAWDRAGIRQETVPSAVMADGQGESVKQHTTLMKWANAEADHIAKAWTIPPYVAVNVAPFGWNGITVVEGRATRYTIVLVRYMRPDEAQVRFTTAHELAHVLMAEMGLKQSEADADTFARCYGSKLVQEYAARMNLGGNCATIEHWQPQGAH